MINLENQLQCTAEFAANDLKQLFFVSNVFITAESMSCIHINPILPGGDSAPLMFFFHRPETAQDMKLKLSDFKDTCLRHILQVIPGRYILRCYHGNKITKGTLQILTQ